MIRKKVSPEPPPVENHWPELLFTSDCFLSVIWLFVFFCFLTCPLSLLLDRRLVVQQLRGVQPERQVSQKAQRPGQASPEERNVLDFLRGTKLLCEDERPEDRSRHNKTIGGQKGPKATFTTWLSKRDQVMCTPIIS